MSSLATCALNHWASSPCLWLYFSIAKSVNRTKCTSHVIKLSHLTREALTCLGEASYPFHNPLKDPSLRNNECTVFCRPPIHAGSSGRGFYHQILSSITSLPLEPNSKTWILLSSSDVSYKRQVCMRGLGRKTSVHSSIKHSHIKSLRSLWQIPEENTTQYYVLASRCLSGVFDTNPEEGQLTGRPHYYSTTMLTPDLTAHGRGGWWVKIGGFWEQSTSTVLFLRNCTFQYKMRISAEVAVSLKFNSKIFVWGQMSSYVCTLAGRG